MKKILIMIALINTILGTTLLGSNLNFSSDYDLVMKKAKKVNKDVYMLITSTSCRWCRKFEENTLVNEPLIKKIEKDYVILHVNRDIDDIPEKFQAKRVPKHYFLTNKGEIIYSFLGYWNVEDFSSFLDDVKKRR